MPYIFWTYLWHLASLLFAPRTCHLEIGFNINSTPNDTRSQKWRFLQWKQSCTCHRITRALSCHRYPGFLDAVNHYHYTSRLHKTPITPPGHCNVSMVTHYQDYRRLVSAFLSPSNGCTVGFYESHQPQVVWKKLFILWVISAARLEDMRALHKESYNRLWKLFYSCSMGSEANITKRWLNSHPNHHTAYRLLYIIFMNWRGKGFIQRSLERSGWNTIRSNQTLSRKRVMGSRDATRRDIPTRLLLALQVCMYYLIVWPGVSEIGYG